MTKKGQPNPAYTSIKHVMDDFVSIAAGGIENADRVRITNGTIRMNEYYGQGGNLVSYPRINASFVNKVTDPTKFNPEASFSAAFMIGSMGFVTDADGVENPNRYKVRGILPQYGGAVDVVDFYAVNPNVISAVSGGMWNEGDTVKINGKLDFTSVVEEKEVPVDFGEPRIEKHTTTVSDLIITGGTQPMEGDFALDADEVKTALQNRQAHLDELKDKAKHKNAAKSATPKKASFDDLGF